VVRSDEGVTVTCNDSIGNDVIFICTNSTDS
jgi:hypothetical protein